MTAARKTVCLVLGNYYEQVMGGAEYQAYLLAEELRRQGHAVHYVYMDNGRKFDRTLDIALHPVRKRGLVGRKWRQVTIDGLRILRKLEKIGPDVVYQRTGSALTGVAAYYAKRRHKTFLWHVALDLDVTPLPKSYKNSLSAEAVEKRMLEWGIRNADVIIAQAMYQADALRDNYGVDNVVVVPNYHPLPDAGIAKAERPINVVWIANIKPSKRPLLYFELADVFATERNVRFYMAGRLVQGRAKDVLDRMQHAHNVTYLGELSQAEVNSLLERSHVLVNTSEHEGFPNTFIQAWMRKVPVVSLSADPDGVLEKEEIGYCSGSMEKLILDCRRLIEDPQLRNRMGERAYRYAMQNHSIYNVRKIVDIIENGYRWEGQDGSAQAQGHDWRGRFSV